MEVTIRKATIDDIPTIVSLGTAVQEFVTSTETDEFWPERILHRVAESKDNLFLVAVLDSKIVGFIIVNCNQTFSKANIENIYVAPSHRRGGVGSNLLEEAIEQLSKEYRYIVTLTPTDDEAAKALYVKYGMNMGNDFTWLDRQNNI